MNPQIEEHLQHAASQFDVGSGDVDAVVRRARTRSRRQRGLTVTAGLVVVASFVAVAVRDVDDNAANVSSESGEVVFGDSGIVWKRQDATTAIGESAHSQKVVAYDGALYAVSTAPGVAPAGGLVASQLYQSSDAVDWAPVDGPQGMMVGELEAWGDQLYAVGTAPGERSGFLADAMVARRTSSGWSTARLPVDTAAIAAVSSNGVNVARGIAASPRGVVVVLRVSARPDATRLIDGLDAPNGYASSPTGIDVLGDDDPCPVGTTIEPLPVANEPVGPMSCSSGAPTEDGRRIEGVGSIEPSARGVVRHYDWAELGVTGDVLDAFQGRPFVFYAPIGSESFERVTLPLADDAASLPHVAADDSGFTLFIARYGPGEDDARVVALRSEDGRAWKVIGQQPGVPAYSGGVGRLDGSLAAIGTDHPHGAVLFRATGDRLERSDLSSLGKYFPFAVGIGPLGVVMAATGEPGPDHKVRWVLLSSRDGRTWSKTAIADLVDEEVSQISRVSVVGDRAVVTVALRGERDERDERGLARQVVLVGTPR